MRNVQKVLIGIFLSGVLLSGIGTGIVVQEFSSLGYGGRKLIGTEDLVTKEMDFTLPMDGKTVILGYHGYGRDWEGSLVESREEQNQESQPWEGQSHEEQNQPEQIREEQNQEGQPQEGETAEDSQNKEPVYGGELYLETRYKGNDFELFMENKDRILEELKQKKLSSYDIAYITEITIKVNPETKAYVKDLFFRY